MYFDAIGPMPFYLAQMFLTLCWSAGDVMLILGSIVSIIKIIYIYKFDLIFNQNQESMANIILGGSLLFGCLPHLVIFFHFSARRKIISAPVPYFMGKEMVIEGASPFLICGSWWLFLSIFTLAFAILIIKNYEKSQPQNLLNVAEEMGRLAGRSISLPRVLLGAIILSVAVIASIVIQVSGVDIQFPLLTPIYALILSCKLSYFVLHENIIVFCKRRLEALWLRTKTIRRTYLHCKLNSVNPA
jgi:hypothetical protein